MNVKEATGKQEMEEEMRTKGRRNKTEKKKKNRRGMDVTKERYISKGTKRRED